MSSRLRRNEFVRRGKTFHTYYLDGKLVPGVTSISRLGSGSTDGLVNWACNITAEAAWDLHGTLDGLDREQYLALVSTEAERARDAAADFGKRVHELAREILDGHEVEVPEEYSGHVEQVLDFLDRWKVQELIAEAPVYNARHKYAGTLDLVARLADNRVWLLDYKTGSLWTNVCLQLAGYRFAEHYVDSNGNDQEMGEIDECAVVSIKADHWELIPMAAGPSVFREFIRCRQVYDFTKIKRDELIGQPVQAPERKGA